MDHQLLFEFNGQELSVDLGRSPEAMEQGTQPSPRAEIFGSGKLTLAHVALFRDIYYTSDGQGSRGGRAVEGKPFTLNEDEFFVLGDNSPNSEDGRWWGQPDMASKGWAPPRAGVVPRYYLVGRALFVYWPSGFEFPWPQSLKTFLLSSSRKNARACACSADWSTCGGSPTSARCASSTAAQERRSRPGWIQGEMTADPIGVQGDSDNRRLKSQVCSMKLQPCG